MSIDSYTLPDRPERAMGIDSNTPPDSLPENLRPEEAAKWLRVSPGMIYSEVRSGRLQGFRVGRLLRLTREAVIAYRNASVDESLNRVERFRKVAR